MRKVHLASFAAALLLLRWLATAHVAMTVAGVPVVVPVLAVAAVVALVVTAAVVALLVYRARAERAMLAAWQAQKAGTP